jgi:hypothetical protein
MGNVFGSRQQVVEAREEDLSVDREDKLVEIDDSGEAIKEAKEKAEVSSDEAPAELNEAELAAATAQFDMLKDSDKAVHFDEKQLHATPKPINRRLTGFPMEPMNSDENLEKEALEDLPSCEDKVKQDDKENEPKLVDPIFQTVKDIDPSEAVTPKKARRRSSRGKRRLGSKSNFQMLYPETPISCDSLQSYSEDQLRDKLAVRGLDIDGSKFDLVKRLHNAVAKERGFKVSDNEDTRKRKLSHDVMDLHTSKRRSILGELDLRTLR